MCIGTDSLGAEHGGHLTAHYEVWTLFQNKGGISAAFRKVTLEVCMGEAREQERERRVTNGNDGT